MYATSPEVNKRVNSLLYDDISYLVYLRDSQDGLGQSVENKKQVLRSGILIELTHVCVPKLCFALCVVRGECPTVPLKGGPAPEPLCTWLAIRPHKVRSIGRADV